MTRNTLGVSLLIFAGVCGAIAIGTTAEVDRQVVASGSLPSWSGLLAKFIPMLGSLGGIAGAIIAFLRRPSVDGIRPIINSIRPVTNEAGESIRQAVDVGEIGVYVYLVSKAEGDEKASLITAARLLCDKIRDEMFPVDPASRTAAKS